MYRIYIILTFIFTLTGYSLFSQNMQRPSAYEINTLPEWARKMYGPDPNVLEIDSLYQEYYRKVIFEKSYHTQYYKKWRRSVSDFIDDNGYVQTPDPALKQSQVELYKQSQQNISSFSSWTLAGPVQVFNNSGVPGKGQSNIYSIDQCAANPSVMYCGSEPGEVYKSLNGGDTWENTSKNENFGSGVTAIEVDDSNPDIVFAGGNAGVFRSINGGTTWVNVLPQTNFNVSEILVNPGNSQIVLVASEKGLYRSVNGGTNWVQLFTQKTYDVKCNTGNPSIVYLVKNNPALIICEFYISIDAGATWILQTNGWYNSIDPARNDGGARIAVTTADPNRVYAYLVGEAKANDYGFIGVYRSDDGGQNWTLPNGPAGGPYTTAHPNLAYGYPNWTYHQGFYNCALTVSDTDADQILIGGLNLWRSDDGGNTFTSVAGYVGGPLNIHVDMQDFRMLNGVCWISTDGGIFKSDTFFNSQPDFKMHGIHASDYWGFGTGWNEDVMVGGLYHNGNLAYHENYLPGNFLELGGGEAPTGYVNPGKNTKTYFSDIGGKNLPLSIVGNISNFSIGMSPNETYYSAESSEMEFHPNCYQIIYLGKENKFWKSSDAGASFNLVYTFGSNINDQVKYIEISNENPDVIYLNQQPANGNVGKLWKTIDGGLTWNQLPVPVGNSRRMLLSLDAIDDNIIWVALPGAANGLRIHKSVDGGNTWTNLTSALLDNQSAHSIKSIAGTDGGIYYCSNNAVYYRNNTMSDWQLENQGLPLFFNSNIASPFYRDGKIRIASYGKGIWESALTEQPAFPIARIGVDKLNQTVICTIDSFYFEDRSYLNHSNATWQWTFQNGNPAASSQRNPIVYFANPGVNLVTLTITDAVGLQDTDSIYIDVNLYSLPSIISQGFEGSFLPSGWDRFNEDGNGQWTVSTATGSFGTSLKSAIFDNFNIDSQSTYDDLRVFVNTTTAIDPYLNFDVAYAPYGGIYSDTLEVLVSSDCGATFTSVYKKGGATLGTSPAIQTYFVPTDLEWRTDSVSLISYIGNPNVMIAFRNIGHFGNVVYLDNVNINNLSSGIPESNVFSDIYFYPNPVPSGECLNVFLPDESNIVTVSDITGKQLLKQTLQGESQLYLTENFKPGTYMLHIENSKSIWNRTFIIGN